MTAYHLKIGRGASLRRRGGIIHSQCRFAALALTAIWFYSGNASGAPSNAKLWTFTQPDGTKFQATLIGDEFHAYHETPSGELVVQDRDSGYWYYASPKADGTLERTATVVGRAAPRTAELNRELEPWMKAVGELAEARMQEMTIGFLANQRVPPTGTLQGVILLANFADTTTTFTQSDFANLLNTPGYNQNGALGSVRDYYYECSYGALTLQLDVYGWFNLPQNRSYYGANTGGPGTDTRSRQMIIDVINAANPTVNFATYDGDGDGWVDIFGVIFQGQGEEQSGAPADAIWSHRWNLSPAMTVDGVKIQDYFCSPERYYSNLSTIGVFCHELGHVFNLPDLYATNNSSFGIGHWGVMGTGNWCGPSSNGAKPSHFDPWCKMVLGWVTPTVITGPQTAIPLPNYDENPTVLLIPVDEYRNGEYFLVCNRYKRTGGAGSGFDQYLPGSGALILHVDDYVPNNNTVAWKKVDVEEADGLNHLDTKANRGDAGDLYPNGAGAFNDSTSPNSRDNYGNITGIMVNTFTGAGTANMTCSVTPRASLSGTHIGYDEMGAGTTHGYNGNDFGCVRFTAPADCILRRVKTYFTYTGTTNYTISIFSGWSGSAPTGLLTSQSGTNTGRGYQEIVLSNPQSFSAGADFYVQVQYDSGYLFVFVLPFGYTWHCDQRSWVSNDGTSFTQLTPANNLPYDLNIRADIELTGTPEVVSVSLNSNTWNIGPVDLGDSVGPVSYAATNDGNVAIDLSIRATNGAGGWTLASSPGANAFSVGLASPAIPLTTSDQTLATNVAVSGTKTIDLTYSAPTSDHFGGGVNQEFTVTVSASKHVP